MLFTTPLIRHKLSFCFRLCCDDLPVVEAIYQNIWDSALNSSSLREVDVSYNHNVANWCLHQLLKSLEIQQSNVETLRSI